MLYLSLATAALRTAPSVGNSRSLLVFAGLCPHFDLKLVGPKSIILLMPRSATLTSRCLVLRAFLGSLSFKADCQVTGGDSRALSPDEQWVQRLSCRPESARDEWRECKKVNARATAEAQSKICGKRGRQRSVWCWFLFASGH